jgi:hypothetical protein
MQRLSIVLPLVLLCVARADTIPTFNLSHVSFTLSAGSSSADNLTYSLIGPGINLHGISSANCFPSNFCFFGVPFLPGRH